MGESGPFKAGYDSRRGGGGRQRVEVYRGMSIAELAQMHTNDAINVLADVMNGLDTEDHETPVKHPINQRIRCIEILLNYGHGKPVDTLKFEQIGRTIDSGVEHVSTAELLTLLKQSKANDS